MARSRGFRPDFLGLPGVEAVLRRRPRVVRGDEPLDGFKLLGLAPSRGLLVSALDGSGWPPFEERTALCGNGGFRLLDTDCSAVPHPSEEVHRSPFEFARCRCGLYFTRRLDGVQGEGGVLVRVLAWGWVVEGTLGWKASRAMVVEVVRFLCSECPMPCPARYMVEGKDWRFLCERCYQGKRRVLEMKRNEVTDAEGLLRHLREVYDYPYNRDRRGRSR